MSLKTKYIILYSIALISFMGIYLASFMTTSPQPQVSHHQVEIITTTSVKTVTKPTVPVNTTVPSVTTVTSQPVPRVSHVEVPVIVPSPVSNVSGLTPVTTPPAPTTPPTSSSTPSTTPPAPSTTPTPPVSLPPKIIGYSSTNWSGYISSNGYFSGISGSWVVPTPVSIGPVSFDSTWIGVGGVTSGDLIQVGTVNQVNSSGQVLTSAFYEILPAASVPIPNLNITPGDSMSAYLLEGATGQWTVSITDNTTNGTYLHEVSYVSSHSTAEWIEEDPSGFNGVQLPFDNFGTNTFTHAQTTNSSNIEDLVTSNAQMVTMVSLQDIPVATPSAIGSDGTSFTISKN